jgi:hypothetical protein
MQIVIPRTTAVAMVLLTCGVANAQNSRTGRVDIEYAAPKSSELKPVYAYLKEARALEKIRGILSPLRLPRRLTIKAQDCDGISNAWYDEGGVTICYEFVDDIWKSAAAKTTPAGISPIDTVIGPLADVILHEVGHAVFDIWNVPIFGREEDAADQFSAYIMLQFRKDDARRLILGNAYQYKNDLRPDAPIALVKFADEHGTPAQRFYNVLCLAYGSDPKFYQDIVDKGYLPKTRAEGCEDEYNQVVHAFQTLIGPHIDRKQAKKQQHGIRLAPVDAVPRQRPETKKAD